MSDGVKHTTRLIAGNVEMEIMEDDDLFSSIAASVSSIAGRRKPGNYAKFIPGGVVIGNGEVYFEIKETN